MAARSKNTASPFWVQKLGAIIVFIVTGTRIKHHHKGKKGYDIR